MPMLPNVPKNIACIFQLYFWGLLFFTAFRIILLIQEFQYIQQLPSGKKMTLVAQAFFMGFRFDTVISGYLLAFPFLILSICWIFHLNKKRIYQLVFLITSVLYFLAFLVCAIDIPYFHHFFSRLTISAFTWMDTPDFVGKMIIQDIASWWTVIPFLVFSIFFILKNRKLTCEIIKAPKKTLPNHYFSSISSFLIFGGLIFLAIRGRTTIKSPIRVGTAYFSNYPFINQLGLNPNFTLIRSLLDAQDEAQQAVVLMNSEEAVKNVRGYFSIDSEENFNSPIARKVAAPVRTTKRKNVIIILMESMSAAKMGRFGNTNELTPFLDNLSDKSYFFTEFYTSGLHTYSGIYATLTSFPTIKRQHPLKESNMRKYMGIASTLKNHHYQTIYFTTHDEQFDNVGGFLKQNDFDRIVAQKDYPKNKIESTLGVPDDFMFEFSIPYLNEMTNTGSPFMAVYLTASDHTPYMIPDYFRPKSPNKKDKIVEYADWALEKFINLASREKWYEHTLFVFLADHGVPMNVRYELPLNYHHSPLIFYNPYLLSPKAFSSMASQVDVFPTIMGMLKLPYINNTLGINLLEKERLYTYFNANDKFGVLSKSHFFICNDSGEKLLYKRNEKNNIYKEEKIRADSMERYAKSMFQVAQWMRERGLTSN